MTELIRGYEIDPHKAKFRFKTHAIPRPSRRDPQYEHVSDRQLAAMGFAWDACKEADDQHQAFAAQGVARRATEEAQRRQQQREQDAKRQAEVDARILEPARRAFRDAGGNDADWEAAKGQILADARIAAAREAAVAATEQMKPRPMNLAKL